MSETYLTESMLIKALKLILKTIHFTVSFGGDIEITEVASAVLG